MSGRSPQRIDPGGVLSIIMGGGGGQGLYPLTRDRATPAVPLAGNYRLIDIPISNCINSGFRQLYVLTQFNSASLHRHVAQAYKFDQFTNGFIEICAAQQTPTDNTWYLGTADAVRKNLSHFVNRDFEYAVVLSADQLYRLDFRDMLTQHVNQGAELTIGAVPVVRDQAKNFGILRIDPELRVRRFVEKPKDAGTLDVLRLEPDWCNRQQLAEGQEYYLASMGIYIFNRDVLQAVLDNDALDFGRDIIPRTIESHRVAAYLFNGYWQDLGSIGAFFEAHQDLASETPRFNLFELMAPIFTQPVYLPGAKVNGAEVEHSLLGGGCIIDHATIRQSVIGQRARVREGSQLHRVVSLGCDYYESPSEPEDAAKDETPPLGIGKGTRIENAIIDRNARIGDGVVISPKGKARNVNSSRYFIRDGIVVIPRNGVIPHGTVI